MDAVAGLEAQAENDLLDDEKNSSMSAMQSGSKVVAYRYATQLASRSGSNFYLAFLTLPRPMYRAMCVIYGFMKITDDIADSPYAIDISGFKKSSPNERLSLKDRQQQLQLWREEFRNAIAGKKTSHPLSPALKEVVHQFQIAPRWLEEVIEGVELDLQPFQLETFSELQAYCYRVAGTVGLCCQAIWGANLSQTQQLAITCGEAFQLTNILRDLHEDAINSRCYLPREDLNRFQCSVEDFANQNQTLAFKKLMQFQTERAFTSYQQASLLEQHLHGAGLKMFRKMFSVYFHLLCKIAREPEKSLIKRAKLSKFQKIQIFLTAGSHPLKKLLGHFPVSS